MEGPFAARDGGRGVTRRTKSHSSGRTDGPFITRCDDDDVRAALRRVETIYGRIKFLEHDLFGWLRVVPRAIDYFEQAPALGVMCNAEAAAAMAEGRPLKRVMAAAGLAAPLRALSGAGVIRFDRSLFKQFLDLHPSAVAQAIPPRELHGLFLDNCDVIFGVWCADAAQRQKFRQWAVQRLAAMPRHDVIAICDFVERERGTIDPLWTSADALAASNRWHRALYEMSFGERFEAEHGLPFDGEAPHPGFETETTIGDLTFVSLRSGAALEDEGKAMHHCVVTYAGEMIAGRSRIFSIRRDGRRLATLELAQSRGKRWLVRQVSGVCNAGVDTIVEAAAAAFCDGVNERLAPREMEGAA